jgi:hypothetical protein
VSYVSIEGNQEVMMKLTTLNIQEGGEEKNTSRITIITEVSKITGLMFCITTLKPTPIAQKTPQCQDFLGTLIFIQVVMERPYLLTYLLHGAECFLRS